MYGSSSPREVARLYGKVRFVTETTTNSIIVTTNNVENYPIISSFIEELDTMSPDAGNTMVVSLQHADARELANQLNIVFALEGSRMPQQQQQQGQNPQQQQQQLQQQHQQNNNNNNTITTNNKQTNNNSTTATITINNNNNEEERKEHNNKKNKNASTT